MRCHALNSINSIMNRNLAFFVAILAVATLNISCEKDNAPKINFLPLMPVLLVDSTILEGSATDEVGQVVAWQWSQVSGPFATTMVNPGNATTQVKGFKEGTYIFQLLATDDKGATAQDTAMVFRQRRSSGVRHHSMDKRRYSLHSAGNHKI